jgi:mannose-6-phosphate isomerase-like protein (cupin superfamily)
MEPRLTKAGERSYHWVDYLFEVKVGADETGGSVALTEFFSRKGDEPGAHVHVDEDEAFYVLEGELAVTCGDKTYEVRTNDFIFLPRNVSHTFQVKSEGVVRVLVLTVSAESVENFERRIAREGKLLAPEERQRFIDGLGG